MPTEKKSRWKISLERLERKRELIRLKGGRCFICAYDRCEAALEFHHVDPAFKEFSLSKMSQGKSLKLREALLRELNKCVLLCCRCHREVHDGLHPKLLELE